MGCLIIFIPCVVTWRLKRRNGASAKPASQDPCRESKIHALFACLLGCLLTDDRFISGFRTFELPEMCPGQGHYMSLCFSRSGQDIATILHLIHNLIHEEEEEKDKTSQQ